VSVDELAALVQAASTVDGIVKGLRDPAWPHEPWAALERLMAQALACFKPIYASVR
jgi:DNA polymerase-3 subunit delta